MPSMAWSGVLWITAALGMSPGAYADEQRPDVYVFLMDDVGALDVDAIPTPNLDALAARGVRFTRAYSMPKCSQTRHALVFSEYNAGHHDDRCQTGGDWNVPLGKLSIARVLQGEGYETALFGKWHLGSNALGPWEITPHLFGFEHWRAGVFINVKNCGGTGYRNWLRADDGVSRFSEQYVLGAIQESFSAWQQAPRRRARFAYVAFQTAHLPWSVPPPELLPAGFTAPEQPDGRERFEAGVIAMDHALGRMLALAGPDALVFVLGDNGTPRSARLPGQLKSRVKGSVFEEGIRVPFMVAGPGILAGVESAALVHVVDLLPTIADLLALPLQQTDRIDGLSFASVLRGAEGTRRSWVYSAVDANKITPQREEAVVEVRWKLRVVDRRQQEFYDLAVDPEEAAPLAAADVPEEIARRLRAELREARR